jgi:hypothetical protein
MLWFVLLDLDVSCCVLFPASTEGINEPPGECTPSIHDKHHSLDRAAETVVSLSITQAVVEAP